MRFETRLIKSNRTRTIASRHPVMFLKPITAAYTVTFGDRAENETGMQMIGHSVAKGISVATLSELKQKLQNVGVDSFIKDLAVDQPVPVPYACVLVIPDGVNKLLGSGAASQMLKELNSMPKDKTSLMYGRVVNKHARYNNCMADYFQSPDIKNGKGTVVKFEDYPVTNRLRKKLCEMLNQPTLVGELNHYFDSNTCGIGWHGDSERKIVVGVRLGRGADEFPLKFQWYLRGAAVGEVQRISLNASDIYISSEKAVGTDWKKSSILTLRHAAGKDTCKYSADPAKSKKRGRDVAQ